MRILYVEDQVDTARVMQRLLERSGHEVMVAPSEREAKSLFAENLFDLWIIDLKLPDGHGGNLLRYLRRMADKPAIALTGSGSERDIEEGKDDGFDEYLVKPVAFAEVLAAIERLARQEWSGPASVEWHAHPSGI